MGCCMVNETDLTDTDGDMQEGLVAEADQLYDTAAESFEYVDFDAASQAYDDVVLPEYGQEAFDYLQGAEKVRQYHIGDDGDLEQIEMDIEELYGDTPGDEADPFYGVIESTVEEYLQRTDEGLEEGLEEEIDVYLAEQDDEELYTEPPVVFMELGGGLFGFVQPGLDDRPHVDAALYDHNKEKTVEHERLHVRNPGWTELEVRYENGDPDPGSTNSGARLGRQWAEEEVQAYAGDTRAVSEYDPTAG